MSKEIDAINAYIENQQEKINNLTKNLMFLETKNKLLEKEIQELKSINKQYKEKIEATSFRRSGIGENIGSFVGARIVEKPENPETPKPKKNVIHGFVLKKTPEPNKES